MSRPGPRWGVRSMSGAALLLTVMLVSAVPAALLSRTLMTRAAHEETRRLEAAAEGLLQTLHDLGLPGLVQRIDRAHGEAGQGAGAGAALWRGAGERRALLTETEPGLAEALGGLAPGRPAVAEGPGGRRRALALDMGASTAGWQTPVADLDLRVAQPFPGPELRAARGTVAAVWGGYGFALLVGLALQANHRRRYTAGLERINAALGAFAAGATGRRVPDDPPAPELRALSGHLNGVLERLEDLIAGLRHVSATAAHEMKIPLQKIEIDLERLAACPSDEARAAGLSATRHVSEALTAFDAVMLLVRLEAERGDPGPEDEVDLSRLVDEQVEDYEELIETAGRRLTVASARGTVVIGEARLLACALANLLENARKYAPPGAEVTVSLAAGKGRFRLAVGNTGGRFPADVRGRAFRRFAQSADPRFARGAGIGLNLVHAVAGRHGFTAAITDSDAVAEVAIEGPCAPGPVVADRADRPAAGPPASPRDPPRAATAASRPVAFDRA